MRCLLIVTVATLTAACAGPKGPGGDGDPITVEHAGTAGLALESTAVTSRGYFELGHDLIDAGCVTTGGPIMDPDGDNIPTTITITLTDCGIDRGNNVAETVNGTIVFADPSPLVPEFRFTATYVLNSTLVDLSGQVSNGNLSTTVDGALTGVDFSLTVSGTEDVIAISPTQTVNFSTDHDYVIDYLPDFPWNPGLALVDGAFNLTGTWDFSIDGNVVSSAALATSAPMQGNPACGPGSFDAGTLNASWDDGHDVEVVWNGCSPPSLSVDGQAGTFFESTVPFFSFD